jgi:hypothetical protein
MSLSILYLYETPPHPAFRRDDCYLQIRCYQAYVVSPGVEGRLGKWMFALSKFDIWYQPAKAVKGQALADLIAERASSDIAALSIRAWAMYFDGSVCGDGSDIGILLVLPRGQHIPFQSDCQHFAPII